MSVKLSIDPHHSPFNFALSQFVLVLPVLWLGRRFYLVGFPALPGRGIRARIGGHDVLVGNWELMADSVEGLDEKDIEVTIAELSGQGKTVIFLALDGRLSALLAIADRIKPETPGTIARLKKMRLRFFNPG